MYLFFDTETTGKYDFKAPPEAEHQPHLVQIGATLVTQGRVILNAVDLIVYPENWIISPEVAAIHGITQEIALVAGIPRKSVLSVFNFLCHQADVIIAHNLDFDHNLMLAQYFKESVRHRMEPVNKFCTMKAATPILKLPKAWEDKRDPYKWPSLTECHEFFCGSPVENAHKAMVDCLALMNIFFEMQNRKIITQSFARNKALLRTSVTV